MGYGHIVIFASLAAIGAGLHVAAYFLEHETTLDDGDRAEHRDPGRGLRRRAVRDLRRVHAARRPVPPALLAGTAVVLVLSVVLAAPGSACGACLVVLMLAPVVTVLGYETLGHRHIEEALTRMRTGGRGRLSAAIEPC